MAKTKWTHCKSCMDREYHEQTEDGSWVCSVCGTPNAWLNVSNAVWNVAEKILSREKDAENVRTTKDR